MKLRPYQRSAVDAVFAFWQGGGQDPLLELATGTGKSLVIAQVCRQLLEGWPSVRIGILAHQKELLAQNAQEIIRLWPQAPIGIFSAGLGRRDIRARIMVMGIQSVWQKASDLGRFDLLIVDEAHLILRNDETRYGKFIKDCRAINPELRVLGLSATPYRLGSGHLAMGDAKIFDKVVYKYGLAEGIKDGFLCPIIAPHQQTQIRSDGLHTRGGEFIDSELQGAAMEVMREAAAEYSSIFTRHNRTLGLAYCAGVDLAKALADELTRLGQPARAIVGNTHDRDMIITSVRHRRGSLKHLVFVGIGTTGLNIPHADLVGMFTKTCSTAKYVQIIGRVSRLAEGKEFAIFADYGQNVARHGPADAINIRGRSGEVGLVKPTDVRAKTCPECTADIAIQARQCFACGYEYPRDEAPRHDAQADTSAVVVAACVKPEWVSVKSVTFAEHKKPYKPPTMRVTYRAGLMTYDEWVAFESPKARGKAGQWWRKFAGHMSPTPETVEEALERKDELAWPAEILVAPDGKHWRIGAHRFKAQEKAA